MKYLFVGLGSIGQRHLKNLRSITKDPIIAYRTTTKNLKEFNDVYGITSFTNLEEALDEKPDVVFITNPTKLHMPIALAAAKRNCHLFIEKPVSHDLKQVEELFSIMKKNKKICFVAFNYRFHPDLIQIKKVLSANTLGKILFAHIQAGQYLPDWHPNEDYKQGYAAQKKLGGGVVLTLIHELDYAYWLFGKIKSVMAYEEKLSTLDIDVKDTAAIVMKTKTNVLIEVHLDYLQQPPTRTCKIIGEKGKLIWDYFTNEVKVFTNKNKQWETYKKTSERNDMYLAELHHFLQCINQKKAPQITSKQVIDVMNIALAIKKSSKTGEKIRL